jgi:hypothetical protein
MLVCLHNPSAPRRRRGVDGAAAALRQRGSARFLCPGCFTLACFTKKSRPRLLPESTGYTCLGGWSINYAHLRQADNFPRAMFTHEGVHLKIDRVLAGHLVLSCVIFRVGPSRYWDL